MATRIRLRRMGAKKRPFYRVVVADQRAPRDGRFIENIGKYHPLEDPSLIEIDEERALHWLRVGAQPSSQVRNLMVKIGIWDRFVEERPSAADLVRTRTEKPATGKLSKKAAAKAAAEAEAPPAPVEAVAPVEEAAPAEEAASAEEDAAIEEAAPVEAVVATEVEEAAPAEETVVADEEGASAVEAAAPVDEAADAPAEEETTEA
ncbi:MAG: 30S ribosomal protein S16 [Actinomycetota bacterium]